MTKSSTKSILKYQIYFILLFIVVSSLLHFKSYDKYPTSIHAWAQTDHYAISLGFLANGFDFFHPKTYSLSHQFPAKKTLTNPKGITAIDFPIIHYVSALGMKAFKTNKPWVFRLVSLIWSFIALFFLFNTLTRIKGFWEALMIVFFILLIPIYAYYQNSFMPSSAAFNSLLIGIAFLLKSYYLEKKSAIFFSLFFIVLAALMRFTQVIFLIALTGVFFLEVLKNRKINSKVILGFLGLLIVGSYFYYNQLLAQKYGSVFLNKPLIADNLSEFLRHLTHQLGKYLREFLSVFHITIFLVLFYLVKKQGFKKEYQHIIWIRWMLISLLGVLSFNLMMSYHMSGHDYYALDTWIPLVSLLFIYLVITIDFSLYKPLAPIFTVLIMAGSLSLTIEKQFNKYKHNQTRTDQIINDFRKSSSFLNENTQNTKKIVLICDSGWNAPMIGWNKDVYRIAWNYKEQLPEAFLKDYDLIITHNTSFEAIIRNMPDFTKKANKIGDNSLVSLWKIK